MRYILPGIFLLFALTACKAEVESFDDEVRQTYQHEKGFFYLKIPPSLVTLVLGSTDDHEIMDLFKGARQVGVIAFGEKFSDEENQKLFLNLEEILTRYEYNDLMRISGKDKNISLKIKESKGKVTELVTIVSQKASPVMVLTLSGEIDIQTVLRLAADFNYDKLLEMLIIEKG